MLQCAVHRRFERSVRQIAGAGFIKAALDDGFGHHRRAPGDFLDARVDLLRIGHLRARIRYSTSAWACTTLGEIPPVSVMA